MIPDIPYFILPQYKKHPNYRTPGTFNDAYNNSNNTLKPSYYKNYRPAYGPKYNSSEPKIQLKPNFNNSNTESNKSESDRHDDPQFFEIFGIKLYFDDILLICLIFFLYNEGVKDQFLFICLILLLLS